MQKLQIMERKGKSVQEMKKIAKGRESSEDSCTHLKLERAGRDMKRRKRKAFKGGTLNHNQNFSLT